MIAMAVDIGNIHKTIQMALAEWYEERFRPMEIISDLNRVDLSLMKYSLKENKWKTVDMDSSGDKNSNNVFLVAFLYSSSSLSKLLRSQYDRTMKKPGHNMILRRLLIGLLIITIPYRHIRADTWRHIEDAILRYLNSILNYNNITINFD